MFYSSKLHKKLPVYFNFRNKGSDLVMIQAAGLSTLEYQIIVEHQIIVDSGTLGMKINRVGIKLSWTVGFFQ